MQKKETNSSRRDMSLTAGLQILAMATSKNPLKVRDGYIELPVGPRLGIELDEEEMKDKIGHNWTNPETYDADDGAVVD